MVRFGIIREIWEFLFGSWHMEFSLNKVTGVPSGILNTGRTSNLTISSAARSMTRHFHLLSCKCPGWEQGICCPSISCPGKAEQRQKSMCQWTWTELLGSSSPVNVRCVAKGVSHCGAGRPRGQCSTKKPCLCLQFGLSRLVALVAKPYFSFDSESSLSS